MSDKKKKLRVLDLMAEEVCMVYNLLSLNPKGNVPRGNNRDQINLISETLDVIEQMCGLAGNQLEEPVSMNLQLSEGVYNLLNDRFKVADGLIGSGRKIVKSLEEKLPNAERIEV